MGRLTLKEYENYGTECLSGRLPACSCACPLNLDIRSILSNVQAGKFEAAYRLFREQSVFPAIVAAICDAPCEKGCIRIPVDAAVGIQLVERTIISHAGSERASPYNIPNKKKRIAVIGGSLAGLACSYRLGMKNYSVTLFERTGVLGGRILGMMDSVTAEHEIRSRMECARVYCEMNQEIASLEELHSVDWDAVLIATGERGNDFGLFKDMDSRSFGTARKGVFLARASVGASPVDDIGHGIVAAHSIEKYIKTGMMDGTPETFMETASELANCVSVNGAMPKAEPADGNVYTDMEAVLEAKRCLKCDCTLCTDACELFDYFQKMPREIAADAFIALHSGDGSITKQTTTNLIASCNLCGLCGKLCPKGINIGELARDFRYFKMQDGKYPLGYSDYHIRDMAFSNKECALARFAPGVSEAKYIFFPGCQLGASDPQNLKNAYEYLLRWHHDTAILLHCCGAPADWGAQQEMNRAVLGNIKSEWDALGRPTMICACPACMRHFSRFLPEINCLSIYEVIADNGLPVLHSRMDGINVSVFDPCQSREFPAMQKSVRKLMELAGAHNHDLPYSGETAKCCGIGAHTQGANPALSQRMVMNRMNESRYPYINYCVNCRDAFAMWGKDCCHVLDIVFGRRKHAGDVRELPTLGSRRRNRLLSKKLILKDVFGENIIGEIDADQCIIVDFSRDLIAKLRKILVMEQEVEAAIKYCEHSGLSVYDSEKGSYSGHLQVGLATIWVEYMKSGGRYAALNVYSHRMSILGEGRDAQE
jgi:Fe-S oxidoreductase